MPSSPSPFASRFRLSTVDCQLSPLSALTSTLTRGASVSCLESALTRPSRKSIKTRHFNSIRCHTYEGSLRNHCRINTYKKQGWGRGPGPGARQNNEGGLAPQVTGQTSQLTAQKVSITSFQFRVSTFGLVFSGGPYFPGPRPNARE